MIIATLFDLTVKTKVILLATAQKLQKQKTSCNFCNLIIIDYG